MTPARTIVDKHERQVVLAHLRKYDFDQKVAFSGKTLKNDPLVLKNKQLNEVFPYEDIYTIKKQERCISR